MVKNGARKCSGNAGIQKTQGLEVQGRVNRDYFVVLFVQGFAFAQNRWKIRKIPRKPK